jgi:hypothetical protein
VAHVLKDGKRTFGEYFVSRPDGDPVAIASNIIDPANNDAPSEANALLIAAAPDLLVALEQACAYPIGGSWQTKARAAIAKAKGQKL